MVVFKEISKNLGTIKLDSVNELSFEFEGDIDTISAVSPAGCGCVTNCRKEEPNKVLATYSPNALGNLSKGINVFFTNKSVIKLIVECNSIPNE
jgi:hypothetical protein